ncbi:uncharacterized protein LOC135446893 isoform X1 [Zonotrichia leucophrys gambelii]|uniref:uncharacterized protein LOC135446893 isoform X1 n=1 Tax=Zonotrichia leucophrys gambelii TaxID=257770 RepID=UPI00314088B3
MAAGGRAPLPGLSPVRGQSAGTAASARATLSLPGPASPGARPAAQNAASEPGAGPMPSARQRRREAAGGALRAGKIIKLLPSLPKTLVFGQPKARGFSARALHWRALLLPTLWVSQGWHREWCRCWSGSGAAALWSHFKGCPCWSTLVPAIPWDTEGALSQVALAPWQGCGSSPRAAGAASREGTRGSLWDEAGESEQRSSLGLEKGKGTNVVSPGHL